MTFKGTAKDFKVARPQVLAEAIVTDDRIALDYTDEFGDKWHILASSSDGGMTYQGHYGASRLDERCHMDINRYDSRNGHMLLWSEWHDEGTGERGISVYELEPDNRKDRQHR